MDNQPNPGQDGRSWRGEGSGLCHAEGGWPERISSCGLLTLGSVIQAASRKVEQHAEAQRPLCNWVLQGPARLSPSGRYRRGSWKGAPDLTGVLGVYPVGSIGGQSGLILDTQQLLQ